jgi:predicted kinase
MGAPATLLLLTGPPGTGKSTLAEDAADALGAAVLGWDWVMGALTPHPEVQDALGRLDRDGYRAVGWSVLLNLAEAQLRSGRSVVVDGVARLPEIERTRCAAADAAARCLVVVTGCRDATTHRGRIEGRRRGIPGWHELDWEHVAGFVDRWMPPVGDLHLDACDPLSANRAALRQLIDADP